MVPFDSEKYIQQQSDAIISRLRHFTKGKLYLEIGGKFLYDEHAERVLPGFNPLSKVNIIEKLGKPYDVIFCVSSKDLEDGRTWRPGIEYEHSALNLLTNMKLFKLPKPKIAVNLYQDSDKTNDFINRLEYLGYKVYKRYEIEGYPEEIDKVVSPDGYGKDQYIKTDHQLVVVVGLGSNSGKLSTCLGQIYQDEKNGLESGYAKYELFPIWNLPKEHPVNLAYEASTADLGDKVAQDTYHLKAHGENAVNYNRDIQAFPILQKIIGISVSKHNQMRAYKSPTDMGINTAGYCIQDQELVISASIIEIKNRIREYSRLDIPEAKAWVAICEELLVKAETYQPTFTMDV